jgi:hypothetical protein
MKIRDITIKKIENLPPHILFKVCEMIDILCDNEIKKAEQLKTDRKQMMELVDDARKCLKGIKGNLSDDIINIEREDRL